MNTSIWQSTATLPAFPPLAADIHVDVAVIGAGMTGITAAYLLKRAGKRVALLERDDPGQGDTGHTTAHLTCVTDQRLDALARQFGRANTQAVWDAGNAAIDQIEQNVTTEGIGECGFRRVPGFLHAALTPKSADESDHFKIEAALARELGLDADFVPAVPYFNLPGMRVPDQATFHPLKYLAALIQTIPGQGSHVFSRSEVSEVSESPLQVKANGHTVTCDYVVVGTHVPLMGKNGLMSATLLQTKIAPYSTYAIGATVAKGILPQACFWDTSDPYYYLRVDSHAAHDYLIFGGEDHKTGQVTDTGAIFQRLETKLLGLVPGAKVDHRWSGQVVEPYDGLPLIGELSKGQFLATGFAGNGMTFGTLSGMMACDAALGRPNRWKQLFDPHRKKVVGGAWDYVKENLDYPLHLVADRLKPAEGTSLNVLQPGEGKLLNLDGRRVAAYRDDAGQVTCLSPTCTHMGCLVRWNSAERTWDCPCHGSRFKCTGEVLAGPAETPLERVEKS